VVQKCVEPNLITQSPATSILLVEAGTTSLQGLEAAFEEPEYTVIHAKAHDEALQCLQHNPCAAVLFDIHAPGDDAFATARAIKATEGLRHTPILFLSATPLDEAAMLKGYAAGAVDFLVQPFSAGVVRAKVAALVRHSRDIAGRTVDNTVTERRMQQLQARHKIDRAIIDSIDLRHTLNVLVGQVATLMAVDAVSVLLLNDHTQTLEYSTSIGFRTPFLQHTLLQVGKGHAGRAVLERHPVHISDLSRQPGEFSRAPLLATEEFVSYLAVPLVTKGCVEGVMELFTRTPFTPTTQWLELLDELAGQAAVAIRHNQTLNGLQQTNTHLMLAYDSIIEGWSRALDRRDGAAEGHTLRVCETMVNLARQLRMSREELVQVKRGALLHDIGKMAIPDSILQKPGPLSDQEWSEMRRHPEYALELLSPIDCLRSSLDIPYCHHEKWDGSGYPRGLRGDQIPLAARVFAVVDVWDALRSDRPFRRGWNEADARAYIEAGSGTHFDPTVVQAFSRMQM